MAENNQLEYPQYSTNNQSNGSFQGMQNNNFANDNFQEMQNNFQNNNPSSISMTTEERIDSDLQSDAYVGTMQNILSQNTGYFVLVEFLIGSNQIVEKSGILYAVGISYIVLYDEIYEQYIICDFYSIKFVTFIITPSQREAIKAGTFPAPSKPISSGYIPPIYQTPQNTRRDSSQSSLRANSQNQSTNNQRRNRR